MVATLPLLVLDASVAIACLLSSIAIYKKHSNITSSKSPSQCYILENQVTHARLLPIKSAHAFTYPTVSLLLSLNALENHSLDIWKGWIFGYGGVWGRLLGLRSDPYLTSQQRNQTIRRKLEDLLVERQFLDAESHFDDAWMMTMPSFLGFEGINPLTVYFCYKSQTFWLVVLEIHNTFGESHVHVLEVGKNEDKSPSKGYNHQWTFLREFHVSPFNDRSGFYTISVKNPSHPPTLSALSRHLFEHSIPPRPTVRVHLHEACTPLLPAESPTVGKLKLTALLRPKTAQPMTVSSLSLVLLRSPLVLLLSLPRILYVAWILHYKKRLDVHIRPEPLPPVSKWDSSIDFSAKGLRTGGGVKWQSEGLLEGYTRRRMETFLKRRVNETGIAVTIIAANPAIPPLVFLPCCSKNSPHLTISYLSARFFTIVFLTPSASHALLLGSVTEGVFYVSSTEQFISTFSSSAMVSSCPQVGLCQRLRTSLIPKSIEFPVPNHHVLDEKSVVSTFTTITTIWTFLLLEKLEAWAFKLARARPMQGEEPWKQWERAEANFQAGAAGIFLVQ